MNRLTVEEFKASAKLPLTVVLDDVRSLYNVGSVFRTCEYFTTAEEAVAALQAEGVFVFSIEQVEGSTKMQDLQTDPSRRYAVVFGNEVKGVHQHVVDMSDGCLEIPQFGTKHSLNVANTASIVIWEFARRWMITHPSPPQGKV